MALVDDISFYAYQRTKTIIRHMGEFTLHDGEHLFRVLNLMEYLVSDTNINKLTVPEIMLLILSAMLHDIGMAPDEKTVMAWIKAWDIDPELIDTFEEKELKKFKRYLSARPDKVSQINQLSKSGNNSKAELMKSYLISDFIRETHSERSKEIVYSELADKIFYKETDLAGELAEICFSHNEKALTLLDLDKRLLCGQGVYACLPIVAVILRLADILDFDAKRTPEVLFSHLAVTNPVSLQEWNKHRSVESWSINSENIQFHAKCSHPAIEASIHAFCNIIDSELSACNNIVSQINEYHRGIHRDLHFQIPYSVDRTKITTKKNILGKPLYLYRDTQFTLSKSQVIDLLMGTKLYGNPEVALRELLQNSIDACLLRQALEVKWGNTYHPEIKVAYKIINGEDMLEITDNGTGMDQYIIDSYYSKVGSSFYKSSDFYDLKSESKADFSPTSRFGIGMLSCFMVADTIIVDTRRVYGPHKSSDPINITIEGQESIFLITDGQRETPGTSTKLILRKHSNPWKRMSNEQFIKSVESVVTNPPFKIIIETDEQVRVRDENSFKKIHASSLENEEWGSHENIKRVVVEVNNKDKGMVGSVIAYILESRGKPVKRIKLPTKEIRIDDEDYDLNKSIVLSGNEINMSATTITINDLGDIEHSTTQNVLAKSKSMFSFHGIDVPSTLFPVTWRKQENQVQINWPLPVMLVLDVCGGRDLDLNSARTQIILSPKWYEFEEELAYIICDGIAKQVGSEYWSLLREVLMQNSRSEQFTNGLMRVILN
ncbi:metal-dependent phosphohydrolase [Paenibacillus sp. 598K]|nr:metal-dependent phosphohydrolase [Paenibacillus sp. 598K]